MITPQKHRLAPAKRNGKSAAIRLAHWPRLALALVLAWGASTACTHTYRIETEPPGAAVHTLDEKGNELQMLGRTPLELDPAQLHDRGVLGLTKEGFVSKHIAVPVASGFSVQVTVPLQALSKDWLEAVLRTEHQAPVLNGALRDIFVLQGLVLRKRLEAARNLAADIKDKYAHVSLFHSLLGNLHYLDGNMRDAQAAYKRALELDKDNEEARRMLGVVRGRTE